MTWSPTRFRGIIPPVVTPLTANGEVDVPSLERLVGFLLDAGVDGLFLLGSSGEVAYLADEQRRHVVKVATNVVGGQVPILVGAIDTATTRVAATAVAAQDWGADAVVVTAPFYVRTHSDEIERHFRVVAAATDLPVFAYDVPVAVKSKLATQMLVTLARDGTIAGVKDSSGDDVAFRQLTRQLTEIENVSVLTGHEVVVDACLLMGADGAVPGLANVDPAGYVRLAGAAGRGDWTSARREQDRLAELFTIVDAAPQRTFSASAAGLGAFKTALMLRGIIATNMMSPPMRTLGPVETEAVRTALSRAGLLS